jgi:lipopolysaccharide cholinephosphotransferase
MKEITPTESKQLMIEILEAYAKFCDQHQLRYYLTYGTLLGAVRHQGFIPWDDDVDVMMPRPDYEKFLDLTKNGLGPKMKVDSFKMNPNYIYPYAKVIHEDTLVIEEFYNYNTGVYIDIFPVDGLPTDPTERAKHYQKMAKTRKFHSLAFRHKTHWDNPIKNLRMKILIQLIHLYGDHRVLKHIDDLAKSIDYELSDTVGIIVWGYGGREACLKEELSSSMDLPFETLTLKAPQNTDSWLSQVYGDYMTTPPLDKRSSTHINTIFWLDKTK